MTNPKAILFICALLPQFVDVSQPLAMQYAVLALTLCLTDLLVMSGYALAARKIALWFSAPGAAKMQNRLFGGFFVAAGAALAFSER